MTSHAEPLAAGWHEARSGSRLRYVFARDFATADGHRVTLAALLAPWFARRTVADLAAAFAGTSVPWRTAGIRVCAGQGMARTATGVLRLVAYQAERADGSDG